MSKKSKDKPKVAITASNIHWVSNIKQIHKVKLASEKTKRKGEK